jgi:hypothetical protein
MKLFLKNSKMTLTRFKKKLKKNPDIGNFGFYQRANFQIKKPYIHRCAKITKYDIYDSEQYKLSKH